MSNISPCPELVLNKLGDAHKWQSDVLECDCEAVRALLPEYVSCYQMGKCALKTLPIGRAVFAKIHAPGYKNTGLLQRHAVKDRQKTFYIKEYVQKQLCMYYALEYEEPQFCNIFDLIAFQMHQMAA